MFSIITSLYKSERYLPGYLAAVEKFAANISSTPFEICAIANNASEEERLLLNSFKTKNNYFKVHYVPLESLYATWNRGVKISQSNIITFWNVDDTRNTEAIKDGLELIAKGAEVVYFPFTYKRYIKLLGLDVLVKKILSDPPPFDQVRFVKEMHCGPFFMFTRSIYQKVGPFDATFRIAGDFDWCVRAAKIGNFKKSSVIAGIFEKRPGTLSGGRNPKQEEENNRILNKKLI